jgi:hypothetical protein
MNYQTIDRAFNMLTMVSLAMAAALAISLWFI